MGGNISLPYLTVPSSTLRGTKKHTDRPRCMFLSTNIPHSCRPVRIGILVPAYISWYYTRLSLLRFQRPRHCSCWVWYGAVLFDWSEVEQTSCETSVKTHCESTSTEAPLQLHAISSLSFVTLDVDNSPHEHKAMIDNGTMSAVAKASLVPESCRECVGKTRVQDAFGECVE